MDISFKTTEGRFNYPALTGSKTPTLRLAQATKHKWEITARKSPNGSTNNQWG